MSAVSKSAERTVWIDVCKGICIILVVYGHISGGLEAAGKLDSRSFWMLMRDWVYLFHMPAFFLLSGIFAGKLSRLSAREVLMGRLRTIFYPYAVWTLIFVGSQFLMIRFVNNPPDVRRALRFLIEPYGYGLWFLYSLFIISLFFYLLSRLKIPKPFLLGIAVLLSLLASRNVFGFWPILNTSMSFFVYYAVGACTCEQIISLFSKNGRIIPLAVGVGLLLVMTMLFWLMPVGGWLFGLALAALGITGVVCLAKGLAQTASSRFWAFLGIFSLEIYLGHPLWGTISRAVLFRAGISSPAVLALGCVFLAIVGSLLVGVACRAWNFPYLFKWPAREIPNLAASRAAT